MQKVLRAQSNKLENINHTTHCTACFSDTISTAELFKTQTIELVLPMQTAVFYKVQTRTLDNIGYSSMDYFT